MRLFADRLSASRSGDRVFSGLSFTVEAGEALVVTGPNGVGKTTLLRIVAGLLKADSGRVRLEGSPAGIETIAEACHYLGHGNGMKHELTVRENLDFWRAFMAGGLLNDLSINACDAAAAVGLETTLHLPYGYLSAGQQRRIAMARLLVVRRPVWLLDEPTAALDAAAEARFVEMTDAHLAGGGIAVVATHQPLGIRSRRHLAMEAAAVAEAEPP